jgi:hypothetical protein
MCFLRLTGGPCFAAGDVVTVEDVGTAECEDMLYVALDATNERRTPTCRRIIRDPGPRRGLGL